MSFSDIADLAGYLRVTINHDQPFQNATQFATLALDAATELIQSYCDQVLEIIEDETVVIDGTGTDIVLLPEMPVIDVTAVVVDVDTSAPHVLLSGLGDNSDYDFSAEGGYLIRRRGQLILWEDRFAARFGKWPNRQQSIAVTYSHGYEPIPSNVQLVCLAAAARIFAQDGATQETTGTYTAMYAGQPGELTDGEKLVLDRYRTRRK